MSLPDKGQFCPPIASCRPLTDPIPLAHAWPAAPPASRPHAARVHTPALAEKQLPIYSCTTLNQEKNLRSTNKSS